MTDKQTERLPNKIKEYFAEKESKEQSISKELFDNEDVKVKTELNDKGILVFSKMLFNHNFLVRKGIYSADELSPYLEYAENFMTLKISRERKSRQEFVDSVKEDKSDDLAKMNDKFSNDKKQ